MFIKQINNKTYLSPRDEYGRFLNMGLGIYGTTGFGKGLAEEFLAFTFHEAGYVVIILNDPKQEAEFSFAMYPPKEVYHLNRLASDGMKPETKKVELYHPFTFSLNPKEKLPDINFYTIPIKSMSSKEWSILAETPLESESVSLMMRTAENLSRDDGLYIFLHEIQRLVHGRKEKKRYIPDPKNFFLSAGAGTSKSIVEVSKYLSPFKKNYFLRKQTCPNALDWKKILSNQESYHVFLNCFIEKSDKINGFLTLTLLNQIVENRHFAGKHPILVIIPEIKDICPLIAEGWQEFMCIAIERTLSKGRSQGRGFSFIFDSQSWTELNDRVKGATSQNLFGKLNPQDFERVMKARSWGKEKKENAQSLNKCCFLLADFEDRGGFRIPLPRHRHKEENYNWIETYKEFFPEKMKNYSELVDYMRKELKNEEDEVKEILKKRQRLEEEQENREEQEKIEKTQKYQKVNDKADELKIKEKDMKEKLKQQVFDYYSDENIDKSLRTYRKIAQKFSLSHKTVSDWIKNYQPLKIERNIESKEVIEDNASAQIVS